MKLVKESLFEFYKPTNIKSAANIGIIARIRNSGKDPIIWATEHENDEVLNYFLDEIPVSANPQYGYNDITEYLKLLIRGLKNNNFKYVKYAISILKQHDCDYIYIDNKLINSKVDKKILKFILNNISKDKNINISKRNLILSILKNEEFDKIRDDIYPALRDVPTKDIDLYLSNGRLKQGYKLYKILELVKNKEPKLIDMQKLAFSLSNANPFNKKNNKGYYTTSLLDVYKNKYHYIEKIPGEKRYRITSKGLAKMNELYNKLKPQIPLLFK